MRTSAFIGVAVTIFGTFGQTQDNLLASNQRFVSGQISRLEREISELQMRSRERLPQPWLVEVAREQAELKREALRRAFEFRDQRLNGFAGTVQWFDVFGGERPEAPRSRLRLSDFLGSPPKFERRRPSPLDDCGTEKRVCDLSALLSLPREDRDDRPPGVCNSNATLRCLPGGAALLGALEIDARAHLPAHIDLTSNIFTRPQVQMGPHGSRGLGCVGFSIAQSINMHLARMSAGGFLLEVSPWETYRSILEPNRETCVRARDQNDIAEQRALEFEQSLHSLAQAPVCAQEGEMRAGVGHAFATTESNLRMDHLKHLAAAGLAPVIGLVTEVRDAQEEWVQFRFPGNIRHAITLVGYGRGVNPFSLQEEDYFLIIDSLTPPDRAWPLKVSADNLINHLDLVAQIRNLVVQ